MANGLSDIAVLRINAPENTLAAFREAFEQGADGVESDYYLSADGCIVIHDKDTERVVGKKLVVKDASFAALRALDVEHWKGAEWRDERIPRLEEVLAIIPPGKKLVIELKIGPEIVAPLERIFAKSYTITPDQMIIISFDANTIAECERRLPQLCSHWLSGYKQGKDGSYTPTIDDLIATLPAYSCGWLRLRGAGPTTSTKLLLTSCAPAVAMSSTFGRSTILRLPRNSTRRLGARWITTNRPAWLRKELNASLGN